MRALGQIFWEFFRISLCVIGGGHAILAVADEVSAKRGWTEEGEVVGHLPVFQMVPGIIAGGTAIYVGRKVAGMPGAAAAFAGVVLPSIIVFSVVSAGYAFIPLGNESLGAAFSGLRAALTGIIAAMVVRTWKKSVESAFAYAVLLVSLLAVGPLGLNPALVIAASAALGVAVKLACGRGSSGGGNCRVKKFQSVFWAAPLVFLKYGLIAFGGGYVLVPVYIGDFVGSGAPYLQLAEREFADVMALTQMTPGPIAVNCATFFGYRLGVAEFGSVLGGVGFAVVATLALLLPGAILVYAALGSIERFKENVVMQGVLAGVRPVTMALMLNALWVFAGMSVWTHVDGVFAWHPLPTALVAVTVWAMLCKRIGVVKLIICCAAVSVAAHIVK